MCPAMITTEAPAYGKSYEWCSLPNRLVIGKLQRQGWRQDMGLTNDLEPLQLLHYIDYRARAIPSSPSSPERGGNPAHDVL